jgi:hypothetical protein
MVVASEEAKRSREGCCEGLLRRVQKGPGTGQIHEEVVLRGSLSQVAVAVAVGR